MSIYPNQKGDTILEVLISVAVLSLVLTTTFALANKNSQANRQANERGEAQKIAQSEMEKLKIYLSTSGVNMPANGEYFCMNDDATAIVRFTGTDKPPIDRNSDLSFVRSGFPPQCTPQGKGFFYHFIQRGSAGDQSNTYTSYVRWNAVTGHGVDEVTLANKVYRNQTSIFSQSLFTLNSEVTLRPYSYDKNS